MSVALVTGSAGLIGSEAVRHFAGLGLDVVGIDNDMRSQFFGPEASTAWNVLRLTSELGDAYTHHDVDIRDRDTLAGIFRKYGREIAVVILRGNGPAFCSGHDLSEMIGRTLDDYRHEFDVVTQRRRR